MMDENELLFDELYEKTKDFGRTQFVRLLMAKERENKELKIQVSLREEVANKYKEVIDKAIKYINSKRYDWGDPESQDEEDYDIGYDEIIELLDILKEVEK